MFERSLVSYFTDANPQTLQKVTEAATQLSIDLKYNKVWKVFIRHCKDFIDKQVEIIDAAIELCSFADLTVANIADFIKLDQNLIFIKCF